MESLDLNNLPFSKNDEVHVICQSGGRSMKVCHKLEAAGFEKVVNVEGGTSAWLDTNLPSVVERRLYPWKGRFALLRVLVVIGAALGHFVAPGWFGLSAFVGAGLIFAGVTDTCGMGMLIARMPWNRA